MLQTEKLFEIRGLKKYFPIRSFLGGKRGDVKAVNDVSFSIYRGETFGLVGESGCGKSTLGRLILRMLEPTAGEILYKGKDIHQSPPGRQEMQIIFQDPYSSLDAYWNIGEILAEPLRFQPLSAREKQERIEAMLEKVGLNPEDTQRFPYEFSGGQRQRIGIARALMLNPEFILCDEPIAALDASIQAQVVNMLQDLQEEFHFTYLFISHDLSMMRYISSRIGVMYLGSLAELAPSRELYERPLHPYTRALLSARPVADPEKARAIKRLPLSMELPSPLDNLPGCPFAPRCPFAKPLCREEKPALRELSPAHFVSCLRAEEISPEGS